MNPGLPVMPSRSDGLTTSLEIAERLGRSHDHVFKLVRAHSQALEEYGELRIRQSSFSTRGGAQVRRIAVLSAPQVAFLFARLRSEVASRTLSDFVASLPQHMHAVILDLVATMDIEDLPREQFVYVARERSSGRYKIGISARPEDRIRELNLGNPEKLELVVKLPASGAKHAHEAALHKQFRKHHLRSEWFAADTPVHEIVQGGTSE
jgi:hypothetical protein